MKGKTVCKNHGGHSRAGIASATFKHGRNSKYLQHLPAAWAQHFRPSEDALALEEELKVMDARIRELFGRMQTAGRVTGAHKKELDALFDRKARLAAVDSRRRKDEQEMVSRAQFAEAARALLTAIAGRISDRVLLAAIQDDVFRLLALSQVALPASAGGNA